MLKLYLCTCLCVCSCYWSIRWHWKGLCFGGKATLMWLQKACVCMFCRMPSVLYVFVAHVIMYVQWNRTGVYISVDLHLYITTCTLNQRLTVLHGYIHISRAYSTSNAWHIMILLLHVLCYLTKGWAILLYMYVCVVFLRRTELCIHTYTCT